MSSRQARILILCKTYPSPSAKHAETSCVAGMDEYGSLTRLYPVPFRLISDEKQFKKWQWITARVAKAKNDHRSESYNVFVDTIACDPQPLPTDDSWRARRNWLDKVPVFNDFVELDAARRCRGITLGLLRPSRVLDLDITPADRPYWTDEEKKKLIQLQQQSNLFDDTDATSIRTLRKLPFEFHYRYACDTAGEPAVYRHKVVDWEVGALYWKVRRSHGERWRDTFKAKLEGYMSAQDLMFLMGTIHRFPDQWLVVSLIYPPKQSLGQMRQESLL